MSKLERGEAGRGSGGTALEVLRRSRAGGTRAVQGYNAPMRLMREIRFSVGSPADTAITNSWAGWPAAVGLQPYVVLRALVEGEPDPHTGYLCNIREIDRLLRDRITPLVGNAAVEACGTGARRGISTGDADEPSLSQRREQGVADSASTHGPLTGERLIRLVADDLAGRALPGTKWVAWQLHLTPFMAFEMREDDPVIRITHSFEFAAAHRLHCPAFNEARNREVFGKCNNPNGHGHNYQLEVTVAGEPDMSTGLVIEVHRLERIVRDRVIDRLDHKHLNEDCAEFAGLNPSVENITRVVWDALNGEFAPAHLARVRVWETPKTYAEYDGSEALTT